MLNIDGLFDTAAAGKRGVKGRAAVLSEANGRFQIADVVLQEPRRDEVLVRVVGAGVCHTDVVCRSAFPVPMPIVLGHEGSGVVEAVGSDVRNVKVGDHVVLTFNSCGTCPNCAKASPAYCFNFMPQNFGGMRTDGSTPMYMGEAGINSRFFGQSSFATHVIATGRNAIVVPKSAPLADLGPLGCGIQTGAGAILNSLQVGKGDTAAVFGGGAVGLSAVMAAKIAGASAIVLVEPIAARRSLALDVGATHVIDPATSPDVAQAVKDAAGGGVTHALDTTGIPAVIGSAADTLLPKGVLGALGFSPPDASLPLNIMSLLVRGITVKAIIEGDSKPHEFIPRLVQYHAEGRLPIERLIKRYRLDEINEAFDATTNGEVIKPLLVASDV
jgi:aryl-alcohol dehydrogenase/geraniol dehydrogenase (NAD+)